MNGSKCVLQGDMIRTLVARTRNAGAKRNAAGRSLAAHTKRIDGFDDDRQHLPVRRRASKSRSATALSCRETASHGIFRNPGETLCDAKTFIPSKSTFGQRLPARRTTKFTGKVIDVLLTCRDDREEYPKVPIYSVRRRDNCRRQTGIGCRLAPDRSAL